MTIKLLSQRTDEAGTLKKIYRNSARRHWQRLAHEQAGKSHKQSYLMNVSNTHQIRTCCN